MEYQKLVTSIIENEAQTNKLNINLTITTTKEHNKKRGIIFFVGYNTNAITDLRNNHIYVFLDNILNSSNPLFKAIEASYHEARHIAQKNFTPNSYEGFLILVDEYIYDNDFFKNPITEFAELDAYLYGGLKAKEYLLLNNCAGYYKHQEEIDKILNDYKIKYDYYININNKVEEFISILRKKTFINNIFHLEKSPKKLLPILDIFMNTNMKFKSLKEILADERLEKIDCRISCAFITNKYFLKTIDYNELSQKELETLRLALTYTKQEYVKQLQASNKKDILDNNDAIDTAKKQEKIKSSIHFIDKTLTNLNNPKAKKTLSKKRTNIHE